MHKPIVIAQLEVAAGKVTQALTERVGTSNPAATSDALVAYV